jgi:hypothetical protein
VESRRTFARTVAILVLARIASGCWESDNASFQRAWEADRRERIAGMRAATAQTARGADVAGDDLRRLVAGKTHESVYERTPSGEHRRYVERSYFDPDGRFVYANSTWARSPDGREGARWRVDGPRLCILNPDMTSTEQCYTIAIRPDGRVQYFIDAPGEETHGLLTKIPTAVHDGQLPPP